MTKFDDLLKRRLNIYGWQNALAVANMTHVSRDSLHHKDIYLPMSGSNVDPPYVVTHENETQ